MSERRPKDWILFHWVLYVDAIYIIRIEWVSLPMLVVVIMGLLDVAVLAFATF